MNTTFAIDPKRLEKLAQLHLKSGSHRSFEEGACAMEMVSYIAGEPHSDHPKCACPVLTAYVIRLNDSMPDDATRDKHLKPILPRLVGTVADLETQQRRAFALADAALRIFTPIAFDAAADELRKAGLATEADSLSSQATALRDLAALADEEAERAAAWAAARAAAESAARAAERAAAWAAAWAAESARAAAESAAWASARAARAAEAAAESAAWAAESAAWAAAWAAESAAWAARAAAESDSVWSEAIRMIEGILAPTATCEASHHG